MMSGAQEQRNWSHERVREREREDKSCERDE